MLKTDVGQKDVVINHFGWIECKGGYQERIVVPSVQVMKQVCYYRGTGVLRRFGVVYYGNITPAVLSKKAEKQFGQLHEINRREG